MSAPGLAVLAGIERLLVPAFASTEHASKWGAQLAPGEHAALLEMQRDASDAALGARNPQSMAELATRSQLLREAAEAFVPALTGKITLPDDIALPYRTTGADR